MDRYERMFENKQKMYGELVRLYKIHLDKIGVKPSSLNTKDHIISRRHWFYMKNIAEGKDAPDIGKNKIVRLLDVLGLELETQCYYTLRSK